MLIKRGVSYPQLQEIQQFPIFNLGNKNRSGLIVESVNKRLTPFKILAHRTIGYIRDNAEPIGLEAYFDKTLRGTEGKQLVRRVSKDLWVPVSELNGIEPMPGKDLITTIDINIQDVAENALLNTLREYDAEHGCAIVMDVETGAIRAMANIGKTDQGNYWETYNFGVGAATEPGSTFKLVPILALLDDGLIKLTDSINLNYGKHKFYDEEMTDAIDHGLDSTTVQRAMEMSSNVGVAQLTHKYYNKTGKAAKFLEHIRRMHLNEPTGIELAGEANPFIKDVDRNDWSGTTIPWMSIGYELQITPLQLLNVYNTLANGGKMMKPYLVTEVQELGKTVKRFKPTVLERSLFRPSTVKQATEMLVGVVERGTADNIRSETYYIAGKTGTAITNFKKTAKNNNYRKYQASFAGFFPADRPMYSCIVVITEPKTGIYGGKVAAPVFKEIADYCYASQIKGQKPLNQKTFVWANDRMPDLQIGYKEDIERVLKLLKMPYQLESGASWVVARAEKDSIKLKARQFQDKLVPNVVGMGLRDAVFLLENRGVRVNVVGAGKVKSQSVKPGRSTIGVSNITLVLD
jgi:cell division protein FtsI (penicillin-binding protein 3)